MCINSREERERERENERETETERQREREREGGRERQKFVQTDQIGGKFEKLFKQIRDKMSF
jgi:hypothetical protein